MSNPQDPFAGMNLGSMFGQILESAQQMQGNMQDAQKKAALVEVEGNAGGGKVRVVASGAGRIRSVRIDPSITDRELMEDLIVAGVNDALRRADEIVKKELGQATGGMDLGPLGAMLGRLGG